MLKNRYIVKKLDIGINLLFDIDVSLEFILAIKKHGVNENKVNAG